MYVCFNYLLKPEIHTAMDVYDWEWIKAKYQVEESVQ